MIVRVSRFLRIIVSTSNCHPQIRSALICTEQLIVWIILFQYDAEQTVYLIIFSISTLLQLMAFPAILSQVQNFQPIPPAFSTCAPAYGTGLSSFDCFVAASRLPQYTTSFRYIRGGSGPFSVPWSSTYGSL